MLSRAKRNPDEYLTYLQQQNLAKRLREEEEQKRQLHVVNREEGFQLYFKGANDPRARPTLNPILRQKPSRRKWQPPVSDPFEAPLNEVSEPLTLLQRVQRLDPERRVRLLRFIKSFRPHCNS